MHSDFNAVLERVPHMKDKTFELFKAFEDEDPKVLFKGFDELASLFAFYYLRDNDKKENSYDAGDLVVRFSAYINEIIPGEDIKTVEEKSILFLRVLYFIYLSGISYFTTVIEFTKVQKMIKS